MRRALTHSFASADRSTPTVRAPAYRADIDGLRAVAVVTVVLFHAQLGPMSGGFVGVDVFFVISGYLITGLIEKDIRAKSFSMRRFYERRVRRLFPALFAMLAASMIAAAILFVPNDFQRVGRNAAGVSAFVSNVFLWNQGSYFEVAGPRPLLHTWSLAIEEQFYLVFPPLLLLLRRRLPQRVIPVLGALALASLIASILMLPAHPSAVFYLPQYRIWELLCGSLLALGAFPRFRGGVARELAGLCGIALILVAATGYTEMTRFPGAAALLPCLGAMLVIHAGAEGRTVSGRVLASRPLVAVGLISYSLYLWHWPLIVFFTYYTIDEPTLAQSLLVLAASFAIGALSWRFIELPFRRPAEASIEPDWRIFTRAAAVALFAAALGATVYLSGGFPGRFSPRVDAMADYAMSQNPKADRCGAIALQLARQSPCTIGDPARATLFLWGDSHAGALYGAFREIARTGPATVYGATPRCPPLLGFGTDAECISGNRQRLDYLLAHAEVTTVIIAARWSLYSRGRVSRYGPAENNADLPELRDIRGHRYPQFTDDANRALHLGLNALVTRLLAGGKHVVLVYPVPEMGYDIPSTLARLSAEGGRPAAFGMSKSRYFHRQRYAIPLLDGIGHHPHLTRVYPDRVLCSPDRCAAFANGAPLYFDSHHLSIPGASLLVPAIRKALRGDPEGGFSTTPDLYRARLISRRCSSSSQASRLGTPSRSASPQASNSFAFIPCETSQRSSIPSSSASG